MANNIISVNNLSFRYPQGDREAIQNISFQVKEGDFICIIGRNGSGKSTLCNSLVGLIPHYFVGAMQGNVVVDGLDTRTTSINDITAKVGLVFQNPFNQLSYTATTVAEELAYGLGNRGVARSEMIDRIQHVAKIMRIEDILDRNPLALSGGQTQRVALGSILIMQPEILVLDECTTQLDPLGASSIFDIVNDLHKQGITVVMVDHNINRVAEYADKILLLDNGQQVLFDDARKVLTSRLLEQHGVKPSTFTQLSNALMKNGYGKHVGINEQEVIVQAKAGLNHEG